MARTALKNKKKDLPNPQDCTDPPLEISMTIESRINKSSDLHMWLLNTLPDAQFRE